MDKPKRNELDHRTADLRHDSMAFTDDPDVAAAFDEQLDPPGLESGSREMLKEEALEQGLDIGMMAGDAHTEYVDVNDANTVGQEVVGGAFQPPDQSSVEDIAHAVGVDYHDNEPLEANRKIGGRDTPTRRWELNPASSDDWPRKL